MDNFSIRLSNVSYEYPDGFRAIDNLSFSLRRGENVALIGANGAGKSTILQLITGLFIAKRGEISINGLELNKKNLKNIRREMGFIFQDSDNQLFMNTVYDDIAFGLRNLYKDEEIVNEKVNHILKATSIEHLRDKHIYKLSGGQKRTVAIAGILAMNPSVILMDEPTASLDPKSRRGLINLLKTLPQSKLIATHDLDMVLDLCERVIVLSEGKIIADGDANTLLSDEGLMDRCNLELPLCMQY
ncbi:putative ABC transporter ATP-binding protein [Clostridium polyendosporum]|uniref:ABC transporter ATP-binding protein n=1 Tax=Clostridium polyendosporum TaxID=69208 RepID=A0A919S3M3_9CLOT|nr:ABC transporter ATP-binding protein [Clostridium polyendosporum]GIM30640.1 putative ABC transporter ATP-binding protein [Clostridium polyendosporum]